MSTPASEISAPAAPPPAPTAATPPPSVSAPSPAPSVPAAPTPASEAAVTAPGAPAQPPQSLQEVQARYRAREAEIFSQAQAPEEPAQPGVSVEEPSEPVAIEEPTEPAAEPTEAAPVEAPTAEPVDQEALDTVLTEEELRKRYHVPNKLAPEIAAREAERGELREGVRSIGGKPGLELAQKLNPIIWKANPTAEDAEAVLDALVLPENAGAVKLVREMGKHFVATALYEDTPNEQGVPLGQAFASDLLREEYGNQPDNKTPYDFGFVDSLIKAHKSWGVGPDGKPVDVEALNTLMTSLRRNGITVESANKLFRASKLGIVANDYIDSELAEHPEETEVEPTEREKALLAEKEELLKQINAGQAERETKAAEQQREYERQKSAYTTQADAWTSRYVMSAVMPLATKSNWAAVEGETDEAKKDFGELISTTIDTRLKAEPEYAEVQQMIRDYEAFDAAGHPTRRFLVALEPLRNKALAQFNRYVRNLGPKLKFAASTSREAQLAKNNGNSQQPTEPPPLQVAQPKAPAREETTEQLMEKARQKYRQQVADATRAVGTL